MSKLHEVLAVESGLKSTANKVLTEAKDTFKNKHQHFLGQNRKYSQLIEGTISFADEDVPLGTTVKAKIDYIKDHIVRSLDATAQKEYTNTKAKADLMIDGKEVLKDVPATMLLTLEGFLENLRSTIEAIPTLASGRRWEKDEQQKDVYVASQEDTYKTEKVVEALLLAAATKEHPAQADKISKDRIVGKWVTTLYSGMLTSLEKSKLIGRLDNVIRETKRARMRANNAEVEIVSVGKEILGYIFE